MMNRKTALLAILLVAIAPACGKKGSKPLGDKKTACDNIYKQYSSSQDPKAWSDACMAAPDETVRCVNLIMEEGKDSACKKLVSSPERTKLVTVLNGKPEPAAGSADPAGSGSGGSAAGGSADPAPMTGDSPIAVKDLGKFQENDLNEKKRAFEVTNNGKAAVTHLQFYVHYYDKDKKWLSDKPEAMNYPASAGIKPGETTVIPMGSEEGKEPEGTAFVEAALKEVEFADGSSWKNEKADLPDRPMGGAP